MTVLPRLRKCDFSQVVQTIAVNGEAWPEDFKAVWQPIFMPDSQDVIAPCLSPQGWKLVVNGKPTWTKSFSQIWHQRFGPDRKKLAAVVCPSFGRWTVAVDGETVEKHVQ